MISAMRRLGRAFLRASWTRRAAALTVTLGLLGGNSMLVATTVFAAVPSTPVTSGGLGGLLGLGSAPAATESVRITIPQQVCQMLPALCQPGTRVFEIPAGVGTLGAAPVQLPGHPRGHVTIPSTGCLLGPAGCGQSTPTPKPKVTAAPTVKPTAQAATTTTPAPTTTPAAPTPTAAGGGCLLGILRACPTTGVTNTCAGGCQATPSPAPSNALCLLSCGLLQLGGSSCVATLLSACVVPTAPPQAPSGRFGLGLGRMRRHPALPARLELHGVGGLHLPAGRAAPRSPRRRRRISAATGTGDVLGTRIHQRRDVRIGRDRPGDRLDGGGLRRRVPDHDPDRGRVAECSGGSGQPGLNQQQPRRDETVGLVSGLSFGHGLILWPLFGLLDLAALAGLVVVVRRRWTATTN